MIYRGYLIKHEKIYYRIYAPDGSSWTADTVREAIADINDLEGE